MVRLGLSGGEDMAEEGLEKWRPHGKLVKSGVVWRDSRGKEGAQKKGQMKSELS